MANLTVILAGLTAAVVTSSTIGQAHAACNPAPTSGNDVIECTPLKGVGGLEGDDTITIDTTLGGSSTYISGHEGNDVVELTSSENSVVEADLNYLKGGTGSDIITVDAGNLNIHVGIDGGYTSFAPNGPDASETDANQSATYGIDGDDEFHLLSGNINAVNGGAGKSIIVLDGADIHRIRAGTEYRVGATNAV